MELDDYKIAIGREEQETYFQKGIPELSLYMHGQTQSFINKIKRNLKLEILFAGLFFIFNGYILLSFIHIFYLRIFAFFLLLFCLGFIYYVTKLLRYIQMQYTVDNSVKDQLVQYIHIISRFTRLYFQLTMVMVPLILLTAFIAFYLDQLQTGSFMLFSSQTIKAYLVISILWSTMMYFFTKWYIKKLYGNHLNKLKEQLHELQGVE